MRWIITFLALLTMSEGYKILVVFPMPSPSHNILGEGFVRHLLQAGHEVTYITAFPKNNTSPKLHIVDVSSNALAMGVGAGMVKISELEKNKGDIFKTSFIMVMAHNFSRMAIEHENVQRLMRDPAQIFDAVVVEWFFSDLFSGFGALFQCPLVWSGSTEAHWQIIRLVDEVSNPAYTADILSSDTPPFTFLERVNELYTQMWKSYVLYMDILPMDKAAYDSIFGAAAKHREATLPDFTDAVYNGSLLFLNSHVPLGTAGKLPQSAKYIGGYHIEVPTKPLPENLQQIMDSAKNGVIYFSMGSNLKSKDMSESMKRGLLALFGDLKQVVFWKFEEKLSDVPPNVHLLTWAPQPSILAHPNLRIFITHGGLLSTTETIHFGVPIIGVPVFGDQFVNMDSASKKGFAIKVDLSDMVVQLRQAINAMLSNPSYGQSAKAMSAVFHDRMVGPGAELVHWVEHVVQTRGAPHLRSPALMVPCYQKAYLDLAAVLLVATIVLVAAVRCILSTLCKRKQAGSKTKQN